MSGGSSSLGGCGLPRARTSATSCWPGATRSSASTTSPPAAGQRGPPASDHAGFSLVEADVSEQVDPGRTATVDAVCNLASPASPPDYLALPARDAGRRERGHPPTARAGRAPRRPVPAWPAPARSTATPTCTRRSSPTGATSIPIGPRSVYDEAKRFAESAHHGHHRTRGHRRGHRPDLQHLRPAAAARRRPGGVQLPRAGPAGRAPDRLRRRQPDPEPLLRRRRGRAACWPCSTRRSPARSTSATPTSARCSSWPGSSSSSPARPPPSCTEPLPTDDPTRRRPDITAGPARAGLGADDRPARRASTPRPIDVLRRRPRASDDRAR